ADEITVRSFSPAVKRETNIEARTRANEDELDDFANQAPCEFLATISPAVLEKGAAVPRGEPSPVDVLILAATSGGMAERTRLGKVARAIANTLRAQDRFRLGCVDVAFRPVTKDWIRPQTPDAQQALLQFEREIFLGETDFDEALDGGVASLPEIDKGRRRL